MKTTILITVLFTALVAFSGQAATSAVSDASSAHQDRLEEAMNF